MRNDNSIVGHYLVKRQGSAKKSDAEETTTVNKAISPRIFILLILRPISFFLST